MKHFESKYYQRRRKWGKDKAKKTGKAEIDGWNIEEGARGEKGRDTETKQQGVQK
jgi:hypothetical protein